MNTRTRNPDPKVTRAEILNAAALVAIEAGFHKLTIAATAAKAGKAPSLVSHHFTISELKKAVMREAFRQGSAEVVAAGLALRDPIAMKAPAELLARARALLANV